MREGSRVVHVANHRTVQMPDASEEVLRYDRCIADVEDPTALNVVVWYLVGILVLPVGGGLLHFGLYLLTTVEAC